MYKYYIIFILYIKIILTHKMPSLFQDILLLVVCKQELEWQMPSTSFTKTHLVYYVCVSRKSVLTRREEMSYRWPREQDRSPQTAEAVKAVVMGMCVSATPALQRNPPLANTGLQNWNPGPAELSSVFYWFKSDYDHQNGLHIFL